MTTRILHRFPVTARLYGVGVPAWLAFAAAGAPLAVLVGLVMLMVVLCA